jgi:hypothetical protein
MPNFTNEIQNINNRKTYVMKRKFGKSRYHRYKIGEENCLCIHIASANSNMQR